jgi:hypothetical protein
MDQEGFESESALVEVKSRTTSRWLVVVTHVLTFLLGATRDVWFCLAVAKAVWYNVRR